MLKELLNESKEKPHTTWLTAHCGAPAGKTVALENEMTRGWTDARGSEHPHKCNQLACGKVQREYRGGRVVFKKSHQNNSDLYIYKAKRERDPQPKLDNSCQTYSKQSTITNLPVKCCYKCSFRKCSFKKAFEERNLCNSDFEKTFL